MDNWVEIIDTNDEIEAQIVKNILEAENIQVVMNSMKIRPYPVSIGRLGEVRLLVRAKDIEKARDVIKAMKEIPTEEQQDDN